MSSFFHNCCCAFPPQTCFTRRQCEETAFGAECILIPILTNLIYKKTFSVNKGHSFQLIQPLQSPPRSGVLIWCQPVWFHFSPCSWLISCQLMVLPPLLWMSLWFKTGGLILTSLTSFSSMNSLKWFFCDSIREWQMGLLFFPLRSLQISFFFHFRTDHFECILLSTVQKI